MMKKRMTAWLLILGMMLSVVLPAAKVKAEGLYEPMVPVVSLSELVNVFYGKPGETIQVKLPVRTSGYTARKPLITLEWEADGLPFELVGDFTFERDDVKDGTVIPNLNVAKVTNILFSVKIKESARKGEYQMGKMHFITTDSMNNYCDVVLEQPRPVLFRVTEEKVLPEFRIVDQELPESITRNQDFTVGLTFQNESELEAKNVSIAIDDPFDQGLIRKNLYDTVTVDYVPSGETVTTEFSYAASRTMGAGVKVLTANVNYTLGDGTSYEKKHVFYLEAIEPETAEDDPTALNTNSDLQLIKTDYPRNVKAEQTFDIKLTYRNEGKNPVKNAKVQLGDYSESGFIPNFIYDVIELGDLEVGEQKTVVFNMTAAKQLAPGTKRLTSKVTFESTDKKDKNNYENTVALYLETPEEQQTVKPVTNSKPKLLVKDYDLGVEKLMAGSEFLFSFDVVNTHSSTAAENIKVTVSSPDNTFSIVEGSSSFLISEIKAGETVGNQIYLRVKGDAATDGYDLTIAFDYEYAAKDENGNDISKSDTLEEKLKIPVYSNDRPMVSNINVGYWDMPKVNEITTLSFEFYNMGKSPLYNVTATVLGDFDAAGSMLMIGNVEPGSGKTWETDVTPIMEGYSSGILHISYEDSNGNISEFEETFGCDVQGAVNNDFNSGWEDPGMGGDGAWDANGGAVMETKKPILPIWAYVIVLVVIFFASTLITRAMIIRSYKKKELKKLEEDLD